ncbi:response regulator transcription factor [Paenibacillus mendelii]|uniref:Response regulator n=1 Tax=Paenibacillus mendelii TaxID=206163 RepID=A0ABV6JL38_9BACL|nr:response regulator [Paenibacillus mendelii]MCQ6559155.1 response regulator [Paenibacillus mendelii]
MIRAMIVEDEPLVRRGILSMLPLSHFGMELAGEAETAEAALRVIEQSGIDLVFTDISMPGMGGLELLRVLRERHPHVRSVVLTCHQEFDFLQQALRLGAVDYIVKTQLDDDSVLELLQRIAAQFSASAGQTGLGGGLAETAAAQEHLARGWRGLKWIVDQVLYERLLGESLQSFQPTGWKNALLAGAAQWPVSCPSLSSLRSLAEELPENGTMAELKIWVEAVRDRGRTLLRNTMYSEEVAASIIESIDMLGEHAGDKLTQAEICKAINMSISYFSKSFKEIVGLPFVTYVQELNIRRARALLETTNYPVYMVSEQSGFHDEKYFGKVFRMKTGHTPSEYRMLFRGGC